MTAHEKYPFQTVVKAKLEDGKFGRYWELMLECGHQDSRPIRYNRTKNAGRGGARKRVVRSLGDAMPHPERIRCDQCGLPR